MTRLVSVALGAILTVSCGPGLMKLPSGPTTPLPRPEVTPRCRASPAMTAEIAVSGKVAGRRVRTRLVVGLEAGSHRPHSPAAVRLEAVASFGAPLFVFAARDDDATLLLPRDGRYIQHAPPDKVLDALVGIPLTTSDVAQVLTQCYDFETADESRASGDGWVIVPRAGDFDVYYRRDSPTKPYQIVAARHRRAGEIDWRVEYRNDQNGQPVTIRLTSTDGRRKPGSSFDLVLGLSQIGADKIDPKAFSIDVPPSAQPITLDQLRDARPGLRKN